MTYRDNMTEEYETKFRSVEHFKWNPWVGKDYHKTGIFVVGISTDDRDKGWRECANEQTETGALFFKFDEYTDTNKSYRSFNSVTKMFLGERFLCNKKDVFKQFWSSVAFMNFYQTVVNKKGPRPDKSVVEQSKCAFQSAIKIIKPKLVLVWTTKLWDMGLTDDEYKTCDEKINGAWPRVSKQTPPIVGIRHPSWCFSAEKWLDFLRTESVSKKPINDFLQYLQQQPTN